MTPSIVEKSNNVLYEGLNMTLQLCGWMVQRDLSHAVKEAYSLMLSKNNIPRGFKDLIDQGKKLISK